MSYTRTPEELAEDITLELDAKPREPKAGELFEEEDHEAKN
jgi:hypothetical protein